MRLKLLVKALGVRSWAEEVYPTYGPRRVELVGAAESMIGSGGREKEARISESAIAGGLSAAITRLVLQPLDVVKTRFQLQVEPISRKHGESKYKSMLQAIRLIVREEKIHALWKGHNSAQILSILYGIAQFTVYEELSKIFILVNPELAQGSSKNFLCGGIATGVATIVSFPFDVTRTRFIAQGGVKEYRTIPQAMRSLAKKEGFTAFFKGLTPTLIQSLPYGACQFGTYAVFNKLADHIGSLPVASKDELSVTKSLAVGFLSGMSSKAIVYPFDVCRKRLQIQGFQEFRIGFGKAFVCTSMTECFVRIYKEESVRGLYKGLQPAMLKAAFVTSIYFTLYERILKWSHSSSSSKV